MHGGCRLLPARLRSGILCRVSNDFRRPAASPTATLGKGLDTNCPQSCALRLVRHCTGIAAVRWVLRSSVLRQLLQVPRREMPKRWYHENHARSIGHISLPPQHRRPYNQKGPFGSTCQHSWQVRRPSDKFLLVFPQQGEWLTPKRLVLHTDPLPSKAGTQFLERASSSDSAETFPQCITVIKYLHIDTRVILTSTRLESADEQVNPRLNRAIIGSAPKGCEMGCRQIVTERNVSEFQGPKHESTSASGKRRVGSCHQGLQEAEIVNCHSLVNLAKRLLSRGSMV